MTKELKFTKYVVMDKDGDVNMFSTPPSRYKCDGCEYWVDYSSKPTQGVPQKYVNEMFPDLTWESEPIKIEVTWKRNE